MKKMIPHRNHRMKRRKVKWTLPFPGIRLQEEAAEKEGMTDERKVIHQAQLQLKVKNLEKAQMKIENKAANMADMS